MRSRVFDLVANISIFAITLIAAASCFAQELPHDNAKSNETASKPAAAKGVRTINDSETVAKNEPALPADSHPDSTELIKGYIPDFRPGYLKDGSSLDSKYVPLGKKPVRTAADDGWHFAFAPYLFATGLKGTIGARGRTTDIDLSLSDVLHSFDIGLMGAFEARKKKIIFTSDVMWIKLSEERNTPGVLYSTAKLGVNMFICQPSGGYRVFESEAGSFDILGGVRIISVETHLDFRAGILPAFDVSQRKTWAAPVVGGHGLYDLSPKFFLSTIFDIGGGFGTHVTGQFYGGAGYRIRPKIALLGGYRYMKNDYDDHNGFVFNTSMSGLLFGAKFAI